MATEKRLIDANALMAAFREYMVEHYDRIKCASEGNCITCEAGCLWRKVVSEAPTVDAVPVYDIRLHHILIDNEGVLEVKLQIGDRYFILRGDPVAVREVVWMPVLGFEGLYEISNLGKVRNHKGETLKQGIKRTNCTCYKLVNLWKDGRYYKKYVHRLIAEAFIPNPDNLPMVNHKDEDGTNNSIDNLEWCTREYNVNYGTAKERRVKKIRGVKHTAEHNKKISESMKRHFAKMDGDGNG